MWSVTGLGSPLALLVSHPRASSFPLYLSCCALLTARAAFIVLLCALLTAILTLMFLIDTVVLHLAQCGNCVHCALVHRWMVHVVF